MSDENTGKATLSDLAQILKTAEAVHQLGLDLIKDEFEHLRITGINPVQAMIIFGLGDRTLRASDLRGFGIYTGSNVSYNIEYLVKKGYIDRIKSHKDRRAVEVSLTKTGHIIRQIVEKRFVRAAQSSAAMEDLSMAVQSVEHLQRIAEDLHGMIRHIY